MATGMRSLFGQLRATSGRGEWVDIDDAELIRCHLARRDDGAFAELVHRHAGAVYGMCRRSLYHPADLEDAFQIAFMVLLRKAPSLRSPERLSGWLCGVADRVARSIRQRNSRRGGRECPLDSIAEPCGSAGRADPELKPALLRELLRLPPDYRQVLQLCDFDGLTRRGAAAKLGIPESTLSNRLTRARAMLGRRLLKRGVSLGVGVGSTEALPPRLVAQTLIRIESGAVPDALASVLCEVSKPMLPWKILAAFVVCAGMMAYAGVEPSTRPVKLSPVPAQPAKPIEVEPKDPEPVVGELSSGAAYSRDGKRLALAGTKDGLGKGEDKVTLYDTATWKALRTMTGPTHVCRGLTFSADGKSLFAACDDGVVYRWQTETGKAEANLEAKAGFCGSVQLSPNGKLLASSHRDFTDKMPSKVYLWDAATGKAIRSMANGEKLSNQALAFSPDGKTIAAGYGRDLLAVEGFQGIIEWDVTTGKEQNRIPAVIITPGASAVLLKIDYTRDSNQLIVAGGEARPVPGGCNCVGYLWVLDRKSGKVAETLLENCDADYIRQMGLSADGSKLFAGTITPPRPVMLNGRPQNLRFSDVHCWDTAKWKQEWTLEIEMTGFWAFAAPPNGKRIGVSTERGFYLLDPKNGDAKGGLIRIER